MEEKKDEISIYKEMGIGNFEAWLTIVHWKATLGGALLFGIACVGLAEWLGCVEILLRNTLLSTLLTCFAYLALLGIIYALSKHLKTESNGGA